MLPSPGPGRPKGRKNNSTVLREKLAERALQSDYVPQYAPAEVLQRVMDGDTTFTQRQIDAARDLLPFSLPELAAVAVKPVPPAPAPAYQMLAHASPEVLEVLRDALELLERDIARANAPMIEG